MKLSELRAGGDPEMGRLTWEAEEQNGRLRLIFTLRLGKQTLSTWDRNTMGSVLLPQYRETQCTNWGFNPTASRVFGRKKDGISLNWDI